MDQKRDEGAKELPSIQRENMNYLNTVAPCAALCYLCYSEGDAERARRLRPGRLAQTPRRLQPLAASAVPADDGVQGTSAHRTACGVSCCHTRRIDRCVSVSSRRVGTNRMTPELRFDRYFRSAIQYLHLLVARLPRWPRRQARLLCLLGGQQYAFDGFRFLFDHP